MPASRTIWTVDMLDALEGDGQRYELIDGELFVTPSPADPHQLVVGEIYARLREYLRPYRVGKQMISPSDVRRGDHSTNRLQPDVYVIQRHSPRTGDVPTDTGDLLLVIEVVSPSSRGTDFGIKRDTYLGDGVPEYWVIDHEARTLTRWRSFSDPGEVLTDIVIWHPVGMPEAFVLDLDAFFNDAFL